MSSWTDWMKSTGPLASSGWGNFWVLTLGFQVFKDFHSVCAIACIPWGILIWWWWWSSFPWCLHSSARLAWRSGLMSTLVSKAAWRSSLTWRVLEAMQWMYKVLRSVLQNKTVQFSIAVLQCEMQGTKHCHCSTVSGNSMLKGRVKLFVCSTKANIFYVKDNYACFAVWFWWHLCQLCWWPKF